MTMKAAITNMVDEISRILASCSPSIYLYGSSVLCDFQLGWSDIGILLYGKDIRSQLEPPIFADLYTDVKSHYQGIRDFAHLTGRSLYTFGWMLDIARCIYTLRTGKIIAKTAAGIWALENGLCPDPDALRFTLQVRQEPMKYKSDEQAMDYAENLIGPIHRFADVLEDVLQELLPRYQYLC